MNLSEKIDLYIEGLLNQEELILFEREMEKDPELARQVEERNELFEVLREYFAYRLHPEASELNEPHKLSRNTELAINDDIEKYYFNEEGKNSSKEDEIRSMLSSRKAKSSKIIRLKKNAILNIAASLILLLILSFAIGQIIKSYRANHLYNELFTEYYHPQKDEIVYRYKPSDITFTETGFKMTGMNEGSTIQYLSMNTRGREASDSLRIFIALAAIESSDFYTAKTKLNELMNQPETALRNFGQWYYSLLLIKNKNDEEALKELNNLCHKKGYYQESACILRQSLLGN